jgi:uncharacterized membrane protein (UPF0127 family)
MLAIAAAALKKQPLTFITGTGQHTITVEVADDDKSREVGLMYRRSIGADEGMLFVYKAEQELTMWMKNTYISLDMIFVRRNGVISHIETNTEPFSEAIISSRGPVMAVIEMGAGSAARLGLKPGDKVRHAAFK